MPQLRWYLSILLASGPWFAGGPAVSAQSAGPNAVLSGAVDDPSGARIPRAPVHIQGEGIDSDTSTNGVGTFSVDLAGGSYTITVRSPGFRELTREISLQPGEHRTLNLKLAIDAAAEELSVDPWAGSADRPSAVTFSGDQLQMLSDDPQTLRQELIAMAGGGSGIATPQFYVDGFSNGQLPPKAAIRSIHINNNPYSTEYDRPGFGRVEIETQAGGNQLHGMVDVGGTDNAFNSENPLLGAFVYPPPPQSAYYQLLFRGNVNGPIGKKTSYFLAGNTSDLQNNAVVNAVNPLATGSTVSAAVPNPLLDNDYSLRLDHQFSAKNQMNGRYEIHRLSQTNAGVGLLVLQSEGYTNGSTTQTLQLDDNEIVSQRVVNDVKFQYIRTRARQEPNSTAPTQIVEGAFSAGGSPTQTVRDNQDQYEFQENISFDHGSHFMRGGMRYRVFRDSNDSRAGFNGEYIFPTVAAYNAHTPTQFSLNAGSSSAELSTGDLGVYTEDEWKVRRNVTLDFGLRYESQYAIPDHSDPAPRLGFVWAILPKKAKMPLLTLRGGTGLFYQRLSASDLLPAVRQNGTNQLAYYVQNPTFYPLAPPASSLSASEPTIYRVEPHFTTSRALVTSLTTQRAIGRIGSITANFLEADGRHQYLLTNANAPLPGTYNPANPSSGVRPLGGTQNIYQFTSEGTGHERMFFSNLNLMPTRRLSLFAFYVAQRNHSDAQGPSSFASNSYDIRQDFGRDDSEIGQQLFMGGNFVLPYGLAVQPFISLRTGRPFNITLGTDANGDTIYNDRPAFATDLSRASVVRTAYGNFDTDPLPTQTIIPYNYGVGPGLFWTDLQVTEAIHVGPRPAMKTRAQAAPGKPAARPERPWTINFSAEVQNLFNHDNPAPPVGVLSSPLFGRSLSIATDFSPLTAANRTVLLHSSFNF
jgi:hypothetical protein